MKKLTALLLLSAMLLGLFTGCGTKPQDEITVEPAPEVSSPAETPAATASEAPADDVEITETTEVQENAPQAAFDIYGPISEETITLTYWKLWPPFLEGYDPSEASIFSTLAEKLNVQVEVTTVGTDSASTKFNLMVAAGDCLDLLENVGTSYTGGLSKALSDEVITDLMPYMELYAPDYWEMLQSDTITYKTMVTGEGKMGAISALYDKYPVAQSGLWIRSDWLAEQGLELPSTLDDIETVLDIFKNEYGCTDAFACRSTCEIPLRNVYNAQEWFLDGDTVLFGYVDSREEMQAYLARGHEWFEKGYFSSDFITANDTNSPKASMVSTGQTGLFDADILIVSEVGIQDSSIQLSAVPPITKNADDKLPRDWSHRMCNNNTASVSTNCEVPEIAVAYMNYAYTQEAYMAVNWGIEGETYILEDGEPVFTDLMLHHPSLAASFTPLAYINPGFPYLKSYDMALASYTYPAQKACFDIFESKFDDTLPRTSFPKDFLSFTDDENDTISLYLSDIETYVTECISKFFTGAMDVEADYDTFVATLNKMGIDEIKAVYQAAYDRFMGN